MEQKENALPFEQTLDDSKLMLEGASRVADEDYEFTLEGILAEFGTQADGSPAPQAAPEGAEPLRPALTVTMPLPDIVPEEEELEDEEDDGEPENDGGALGDIIPNVEAPQSVTLQEILAKTVQDVLDEQKNEPVLEEPTRFGLFSRKKRETEELYSGAAAQAEKPEAPEEPEEPEPSIEKTVAEYREAAQNSRRVARWSAAITLVMWLPTLLERIGLLSASYREDPMLGVLPFLIAELAVCVLGREVFLFAWEKLCALHVTYELMTALLCVATLADGALVFFAPSRVAAALPMCSVAALSMTCALWGRALLFRALYDSFRVAAAGDPPYIVVQTAGGAAKRRGGVAGFSVTAQREDAAYRWQTVILPVILIADIVFAVLSTVEGKNASMAAWNFSAILGGANALAFPLVYSLPLRRLMKRFIRNGSALAGYAGAARIRRSNCVILTDGDLFPPGTVTLNGLKIFGEESGKVLSYSATMAHATDSGLSRLFDSLLEAEGGRLEPLSDLNFYEEGGVGGTIHGETVLFGTSSFCRKMGVPLPHGLTLKTGVFLAVDGALIAVFAVKYMPAENVDWALHALARAHITPVLAVRDGNITPTLLRRKFGTDARAVYPQLSTRLALSEKEGEQPLALIRREGLMPYAELAVGSKRLCRAVLLGTVLTLFASVAGTMLSFYLSFVAAYTLFTPFTLLAYLLLWAVAALVDGVIADRY